MTLDEAIEHQKRAVAAFETLPDKDARDLAEIEREKAFLFFFEDLKWRREGKPVPDDMKELQHRVMGLADVLESQLTKPSNFDGCWWLDLSGDFKSVCVELNRSQEKCWGVSVSSGTKKAEEAGFGEGPDEVFATIDEVVAHIESLKVGERDGS